MSDEAEIVRAKLIISGFDWTPEAITERLGISFQNWAMWRKSHWEYDRMLATDSVQILRGRKTNQ